MKNKREGEGQEAVGVELKYCEHCGSLWVRERGAGVVYCDNCQPKVAELPPAKKKPERVSLPVRPHTVVEDHAFDEGDAGENDEAEFEAAAGGAA